MWISTLTNKRYGFHGMSQLVALVLTFVLALGLISCSEDSPQGDPSNRPWGLSEPQIITKEDNAYSLTQVSTRSTLELRMSDRIVFPGEPNNDVLLRSDVRCQNQDPKSSESEAAHVYFKTLERPMKKEIQFKELMPVEALYSQNLRNPKKLFCSINFVAKSKDGSIHVFNLHSTQFTIFEQKNHLHLRQGIFNIEMSGSDYPRLNEYELGRYSLFSQNPNVENYQIFCSDMLGEHPTALRAVSLTQFEFKPKPGAKQHSPIQICRAFALDQYTAVLETSQFFILGLNYPQGDIEPLRLNSNLESNRYLGDNPTIFRSSHPVFFGKLTLINPTKKPLYYIVTKVAQPELSVTFVGGIPIKARDHRVISYRLPATFSYSHNSHVTRKNTFDVIQVDPGMTFEVSISLSIGAREIRCSQFHGLVIRPRSNRSKILQVFDPYQGPDSSNVLSEQFLMEKIDYWVPFTQGVSLPQNMTEHNQACHRR